MSEKKALQCKVAWIGESWVGKTSIINRYVSNIFRSRLVETDGASFTTKTIFIKDCNDLIKFEIWDTPGKEKYRAFTKAIYKNAAVIILVYDITRRDSFEELKNYWFKEIKPVVSPNTST